MKISSKVYQNKYLHKGLEFASEKSPLFVAGTTFALSAIARPATIMATPKTDKENKKLACVKSLISAGLNFGITLCLALPLLNGMKALGKKPNSFMKKETIERLKDGAKDLSSSKTFNFAGQLFKLGLGAVIAAPKSIINARLLPKIVPDEKKETKDIHFKGIPKIVGKVLDNNGVQNFAHKYKDSNFPMHISAITDTIATGTFIYQNNKSTQIKKEKRDVLNKNCALSTGLSIGASYIVDSALNKPTEKFINNFRKANKTLPNLEKCVEGIRIAKATLIMGGIYYIAIPLVSTFFAERIKKPKQQNQPPKNIT